MLSSLLEDTTLEALAEKLTQSEGAREKLEVLNRFLEEQGEIENQSAFEGLSLEEEIVMKGVIACGQGGLLSKIDQRAMLLEELLPVERFYHSLGGIVGYQATMLSLFRSQEQSYDQTTFHSPQWWDVTQDSAERRRAILSGILHLPEMAEIYPLGGAGDRLALVDPKNNEALPAAVLPFGGKTLLQGLIEDLQAREYVYFKLTGKICLTPIAIMTSQEKDNHRRIVEVFHDHNWFGRPKESFRFFMQPLVPVMDNQGKWCARANGRLLMKPGGHGVMWKLAQEAKIFDWLAEQGRTKAFVRQVNNPMAGCDFGLLALSGIGCAEGKDFGVASCRRLVGSQEGMNVLKKTSQSKAAAPAKNFPWRNDSEGALFCPPASPTPWEGLAASVDKKVRTSEHFSRENFSAGAAESKGISYCISNVEYCEFQKRGIVDKSEKRGSLYSRYPSNTNILFVDLLAVQRALKTAPIPGMLINRKRSVYFDEEGKKKEGEVARLESTMQNIADHMGEYRTHPIKSHEVKKLRTFLTYNERKKTISCTKKKYIESSSLLETPEGCFLDVLENAYDLLANHCGFDLPKVRSSELFFPKGPSFLFFYHPALGPLYSVIAQKLRKGILKEGSSLDLQLSEVALENITIEGSVAIRATHPLGQNDQHILYSDRGGKCRLSNVRFINRGIDFSAPNCYWSRSISYRERFEICLIGSGEFHAENITFEGPGKIIVEDGIRLVATKKNGQITFVKEALSSPTWRWSYRVGEDQSIALVIC